MVDMGYHYAINSWCLETVDSTGNVDRFNSLAISVDGKAHVSYHDATNILRVYTNENGSWVCEKVDANGGFTSMDLDSGENAHISYYDSINYDLKYATNKSGDWVVEIIDNNGDVGQFSSLSLDSEEKVHISYFDVTNGELKYTTNNSGSWSTNP